MPVVDRTDKMVLQFRDVLAETERLSPDELEAYQRQLLEPLLLHARQHVPFYAQRLAPVFPGGKLDLSRFHEIPILTRAQAQANGKTLAAGATFNQTFTVRAKDSAADGVYYNNLEIYCANLGDFVKGLDAPVRVTSGSVAAPVAKPKVQQPGDGVLARTGGRPGWLMYGGLLLVGVAFVVRRARLYV